MTYLALTIGPIYKTMLQSRKTRELWSASFSFSLLMKCLIEEFSKHGELLSPSPNVQLPMHGAGVYPDRCFFILNETLDETTINNSRRSALKAFGTLTGFNELDYFQIYVVQKTITSNPIQELNITLDAVELTNRVSNSNPLKLNDYWKDSNFFKNFYDLGFGDKSILPLIKVIQKNGYSNYFKRFKSVPEISTTELEWEEPEKYWNALGIQYIRTDTGKINFEQIVDTYNDDVEEDNIITALKETFKDDFSNRHKYFSIVQADGDNVGSLIKEIEHKNGNILEFSNALNDFVKEAAGELISYGAFPIYMGGDDLLFFAPVTNSRYENGTFGFQGLPNSSIEELAMRGSSIFFLLTRLNYLFKSKLAPIVNQYMPDKSVSLSFGLSIGYYKKPMNEIHGESYELLFHNAKNQSGKNHIALRLEKHSGQTFEFGFNQGSKLYYHFLKLTTESRDKKENFLNSVMFKINNQKKLITEIGHDVKKLTHFFEENFNESRHHNFKDFFKEVAYIIVETFNWFDNEKPQTNDEEDKRINRIYSTLRFIQFLNAKDSHE